MQSKKTLIETAKEVFPDVEAKNAKGIKRASTIELGLTKV